MNCYFFIVFIYLAITGNSDAQFSSLDKSSTPLMNGLFLNRNVNRAFSTRDFGQIPFPQCVQTQEAAMLLSPTSIQNLFAVKLREEESKLTQERTRNNNLRNTDILDFEAAQLRSDSMNGALIARTASQLSVDIMKQLNCETNSTVSQELNEFLKQIPIPANTCAFNPNADCSTLTKYRTITGVCNNLQHPYQGSSQTAFGRLLPPVYSDGLNLARSKSVLGGPLPDCRQISLTLGSKPAFDATFNNFFVSYGQFLVHDITFALAVTDTGRTPVTSCTCDSQDSSLCTVIPIPSDDPFMAGQRCMSSPATTAAFTEEKCTLGVKEQMNGNSHYIDLSATYGSTKETAHGLRMGNRGLLKTAKRPWSKLDLPPGQREGKTCTDATMTDKCFAGGDSRLMENVLLSGIQTQWVRAHNKFSEALGSLRPEWAAADNILYEETRKILSGLHQRYTYEHWLPILIGRETTQRFVGDINSLSQYDPSMPGVIFNEVATSALRLHTLVRDLLSRCLPNGQFTDQVWLRDISAKCKLAYDAPHHGVDGFLCGSFFDFGFAGDTNFAQEIHHRLFESQKDGHTKRHDIVSINVCRGREHGIAGYNVYRQLCGLRRATQFEDFADTMSAESISKLKSTYKHVEDVDLFIGTNYEKPITGGLVGPVSACIIGIQFRHLKFGDRFFYTHQGQFTPAQLQSIRRYSYACFVCHTTDIDRVPTDVFRPPNDSSNPLQLCSQCPQFDFGPWAF